jgi:hypothetical protein
MTRQMRSLPSSLQRNSCNVATSITGFLLDSPPLAPYPGFSADHQDDTINLKD